jgi:hypothetical protein
MAIWTDPLPWSFQQHKKQMLSAIVLSRQHKNQPSSFSTAIKHRLGFYCCPKCVFLDEKRAIRPPRGDVKGGENGVEKRSCTFLVPVVKKPCSMRTVMSVLQDRPTNSLLLYSSEINTSRVTNIENSEILTVVALLQLFSPVIIFVFFFLHFVFIFFCFFPILHFFFFCSHL